MAENLSGWIASAEHVLGLMEKSAALVAFGLAKDGESRPYKTDSGDIRVTIGDRAHVYFVAGERCEREKARALIAARMQNRLI